MARLYAVVVVVIVNMVGGVDGWKRPTPGSAGLGLMAEVTAPPREAACGRILQMDWLSDEIQLRLHIAAIVSPKVLSLMDVVLEGNAYGKISLDRDVGLVDTWVCLIPLRNAHRYRGSIRGKSIHFDYYDNVTGSRSRTDSMR